MKVIKETTTFGIDIILEEDNKFIRFSYGGNLDLYWSIHINDIDIHDDTKPRSFIITKENYGIYRLFEKLYNDIENINIFNEEEYIEEQKKHREKEKNRYRLFNFSNYNELFNPTTRTITWYSDETAHEVANILTIKQERDSFKIEFYTQPFIEGYDEDFHTSFYIPIRFRNSGSSYAPFNILFMKMYNDMKEIDDIKDIGHQIHIYEYCYEKEKKLIKK